jgi:hypothetical protein
MAAINDIRAIAYSEASTLSAAMALMAKRRNDLDAAMRASADQPMPMTNDGAVEARALEQIEPTPATQQLLDRTA